MWASRYLRCGLLDTYLLCGPAQRWGLRCHWELFPIGDSERASKIMIHLLKTFSGLFATVRLWCRFWEFWAYDLKSRLQLNHVPVHETHSAKVRKIPITCNTPSLNRTVLDLRLCPFERMIIWGHSFLGLEAVYRSPADPRFPLPVHWFRNFVTLLASAGHLAVSRDVCFHTFQPTAFV